MPLSFNIRINKYTLMQRKWKANGKRAFRRVLGRVFLNFISVSRFVFDIFIIVFLSQFSNQ